MSDDDEDDDLDIPLQDQHVFGAGLKLKRVKFVPSSKPTSKVPNTLESNRSAKQISNAYLDLVLPTRGNTSGTNLHKGEAPEICEICALPLTSLNSTISHDASLTHQICLPHSHPPSAIDRKRKGLSILAAQGWDPDARLGLGLNGQGRTIPIKTIPKDDKLGIGVVLPKGELEKRLARRNIEKEAAKKLDAGRVRKMYVADGKKRIALQQAFYGRDDVERYLGKAEEWE